MRIYLDACCVNRPFDDQSQTRIHLESEAVIAIIERAEQQKWTLLSSAVLIFELSQIPDPQRRLRTQKLLTAARDFAPIGAAESVRAKQLCTTYGLRGLDALHLACAETLQANVFLTTDDRLGRAVGRKSSDALLLLVANPLAWLTEFLASE